MSEEVEKGKRDIHNDVIERSFENLIVEINAVIAVLDIKIEKTFVGSVAWERLAKAKLKLVEARQEIQKMRDDEVDKGEESEEWC